MSEQQKPDEPVVPVLTAKQAKRANASVIGMFIATGLTLAIVLLPVLLNPAPKAKPRNVDVAVVSAQAAADAGYTPLAPELPDGWSANYARWEADANGGVPSWEVGYVTPGSSFIELTQTTSANPTWVSQITDGGTIAGERTASGAVWELRDASDGDASLVAEISGSTVVLHGDADLAEFDILADAVVQELTQDAQQ